ncbi:chromate transporter [Acholeplasma granularum]|uniref:chromate transporter n=1 Tax=Acholeplasma granularum TaxID=264635 RepID=UPI0004B365E7|nr:chromate transporter [Acholeplasma granularum]
MAKTSYFQIFITFFKIGLFTFGGGYAMMRVMERELVENKGWIDGKTMLDLLGISQSTPGPFAVNSATYIGHHQRGFLGSFFATLGVVLPSFIIIILISIFLEAFNANIYIQNTLKGINAGVSVLIFQAWFRLTKQLGITVTNVVLMIIGFAVSLFIPSFSIVYLILITAISAIIYGYVFLRGEENGI